MEVFVALRDQELGLGLAEVVLAHDRLEAHIARRIDEDVERLDIRMAQDVVGAAADEDARAARGKAAHRLALEEDDAVREIVVADGAELLRIDVARVAAADGMAFFGLVEQVFREAGLLDDVVDEVAVITRNAEVVRDALRNLRPFAAVLAADRDDEFCFCSGHEVSSPCKNKRSCRGDHMRGRRSSFLAVKQPAPLPEGGGPLAAGGVPCTLYQYVECIFRGCEFTCSNSRPSL